MNNSVTVDVSDIAIRGSITCSKSQGTSNDYAYRIGNIILFSIWTNITSDTDVSFRDYTISGLCNGNEIISSVIFTLTRNDNYKESGGAYGSITNSHDQSKVFINSSTGDITFSSKYLTTGSYPAIMTGSITLVSQ